MKAVALTPGTTTIRLIDLPEPAITSPDDVKVRILRVGICGTDREEASGGRAWRRKVKRELVIGHEMFGQVVETGKAVTRVKTGDYAVFTVRRGCGECLPCLMNRSDMCLTGKYRERGIWGMDGYQTEYAVDKEQYIVRVPDDLETIGVLTEPLSVAEKAIDESVRLQSARLPGSRSHAPLAVWTPLPGGRPRADRTSRRPCLAPSRRRGLRDRCRGCGQRPPAVAHSHRGEVRGWEAHTS